MKCEIIESEPKKILPEVGELYWILNGHDFYIRIPDDQGRLALQKTIEETESKIFGVCLNDGEIRTISRDSEFLCVVEQAEPAKCVVKK